MLQASPPASALPQALEATAPSFTALCMLVQWRSSQSTTGSRTTGSPGGHAEVGDELGHQEPTRENGWRCLELGAAWGWAGLMVPRQLPQAQAFSMSAKEENAKSKHFLIRTDFNHIVIALMDVILKYKQI